MVEVAGPSDSGEQAHTEQRVDPPVDSMRQLEGTSSPPSEVQNAPGDSSGAVRRARRGRARPSLSPRWRRVVWATLGSLLLYAAYQDLVWRWRKAWMWIEHPHLIRPRTIPNTVEATMTGLVVLKWLQGLFAPRQQRASRVRRGRDV